MNNFSNNSGRNILLKMVKAIQDNKDCLGTIDGLIGDGDHGMNMNKGFSIYGEQLGAEETSFSDGLADLGMVLINKIGGSMGPIYGTIFMSMADCVEDNETVDLILFIDMLQAGLDGLYEIVDARPGDKTLVDTLYPALTALKTSQVSGETFSVALNAMKLAAEEGMLSTTDMVAKYGRSARLGERSRGTQDAGATSCYILLNAMADGMLHELEKA